MTSGDFRATLVHLRRLIDDAQYKRALNLIDVTLKTDDVNEEQQRKHVQEIEALVEKTTTKALADAKMTLRVLGTPRCSTCNDTHGVDGGHGGIDWCFDCPDRCDQCYHPRVVQPETPCRCRCHHPALDASQR